MDRGPEGGAGQQNQVSGVNLEIYAPTAESADKAECAIAKLIEQAARVPALPPSQEGERFRPTGNFGGRPALSGGGGRSGGGGGGGGGR